MKQYYYYYSNDSSCSPINTIIDTTAWRTPVTVRSSSYWTIMVRMTNPHHRQQRYRGRDRSDDASTKSSSNTFPYETHRYVRSRLVEDNPSDKYDLKRMTNDRTFSDSATATIIWSRSHLGGSSSSSSLKTNTTATNASSTSSFLLPSPSSSSFFREYWTNGRITYLYSLPSSVGSSMKPQSRLLEKQQHLLQQQQQHCQDHHHRAEAIELADFNTEPVKKHIDVGNNSNARTKSALHRPSSQNNNDGSSNNNIVRNSLIAGSAAGMASLIVCHPFDVLRVKMQSAGMTRSTMSTATKITSSDAAAARIGRHPSVLTTLKNTIQFGGGFRALYTGLMLPLAAQAVYKGTIFTVNKVTETAILNHRNKKSSVNISTPVSMKQLTMVDKFVSGALGGAVNAALFCTPVEYVRNQQIAQIKDHRRQQTKTGPLYVIQKTLHQKGLRGLWKGASSTILRDSIGCGCFFLAMSFTQDALSGWRHQQSSSLLSFSSTIISGAAAGVAYWVWALPVDSMKTWIQTGRCSNLRQAIQLAHHRGISTLFHGYQVAYARGAPSAAITVTTYSFVYQYLE